jgi:hypothetical protein
MMPERFWACMRAGEACNDHGNESKVFNGMIPTEHTATCCPVAQWLLPAAAFWQVRRRRTLPGTWLGMHEGWGSLQ